MLTLKMDIDTEIFHNTSVDPKYVLTPINLFPQAQQEIISNPSQQGKKVLI